MKEIKNPVRVRLTEDETRMVDKVAKKYGLSRAATIRRFAFEAIKDEFGIAVHRLNGKGGTA